MFSSHLCVAVAPGYTYKDDCTWESESLLLLISECILLGLGPCGKYRYIWICVCIYTIYNLQLLMVIVLLYSLKRRSYYLNWNEKKLFVNPKGKEKKIFSVWQNFKTLFSVEIFWPGVYLFSSFWPRYQFYSYI